MTKPRPFLKWAGGKTHLLPRLLELVDRVDLKNARYHEPFLGGGALFFELASTGRLGRKKAMLSDLNEHLVNAYQQVQSQVKFVVQRLHANEFLHQGKGIASSGGEEFFYERRSDFNENPRWMPDLRAGLFIYLNKTCYNGLWRVNSKGEFNVPYGHYKNPAICDEENLLACSKALRKATIDRQGFVDSLLKPQPGDLVYCDPPYHDTYSGYTSGGFSNAKHSALATFARYLAHQGVHVIISNSDTEYVRNLYNGMTIEVVDGHRAISCNGSGRGKMPELLIHNLPEAS